MSVLKRHAALKGLYAITPERPDPRIPLEAEVAAAIRGGARLVQFRNKSASRIERHRQGQTLLALCRRHSVPLIVNDNLDLAMEIGADGVHLGRDDIALKTARRRLKPDAIIGISCYDSLPRALAAQAGGASYVAFGRFFPSASKPRATPAGPELLRQARALLRLPIVAIGGITPENGGPLVNAGADMLAAIAAVFGQGDAEYACSLFEPLFSKEDTGA